MLRRTLSNTRKQVSRSGWVAWASIGVMTLALFVATSFAALAIVSNLYIQYVETKPSMYVFFSTEVPEARIKELQNQFGTAEGIQRIEYTSWEKAVMDYREFTSRTQSQITAAIKDNSLPASLDIRLFTLDDTDRVLQQIEPVANEVNKEFGGNDVERIVWVAQDKEKVEDLRQIFGTLRIFGLGFFILIITVIFLFTLITVEFRTYNRSEEIGVMQLVGGSLTYIRLPFVLEGAVYGIIGALLSSGIFISMWLVIFVWKADSEFTQYILRFLAKLPWPHITWELIVLVVILKVLLAAIIGGMSSMVAIRKYIK